MKNLTLITAIIFLFASMNGLVGQTKINAQPKAKTENAKKAYAFKTLKEKEMRVKVAYRKLTYNLKDTSYPKDILALEKRELICLITAKVIDDKTS